MAQTAASFESFDLLFMTVWSLRSAHDALKQIRGKVIAEMNDHKRAFKKKDVQKRAKQEEGLYDMKVSDAVKAMEIVAFSREEC
ncbi:unnamed protein product [Clonostachys rosea f. rosea IK726]|uniref:Uncharacterized protein n=1 Tax=Clonostachys rosea f. rosea IK726 TaxID=1349383 RepID=A0ACA9TZ35_BIOOC|nr:unnamed protein product [Clonostachys rosea f. rosea IK726]